VQINYLDLKSARLRQRAGAEGAEVESLGTTSLRVSH
jgi:hypothetical protein